MTMFLSVFVTVTSAPGTTAPDGSLTVPRISPVTSCAKEETVRRAREPIKSRIFARISPPKKLHHPFVGTEGPLFLEKRCVKTFRQLFWTENISAMAEGK